MDILIKSMELPKSCEGCFACEEFSYECYDYCNILKAPTTRGERRKDCPLVALPEHGRLIDADEIVRLAEQQSILHFSAMSAVRQAHTFMEATNGSDN